MTIWSDLVGSEIRQHSNKFNTRAIQFTSGTKPPLILLHGIGGHAEAYSRNVRRLGRDFDVYAIDFLWHGYSQKEPFAKEWLPLLGEQVIDFIEGLGVEKVFIEGESLGGWVTLWLALNYPDRIRKMVLNTPAGAAGAIGEAHPEEGRLLLAQRSKDTLTNLSLETVRKRLEWLMASPDRVTDELVDIRYQIYADPKTQSSLSQLYDNSFGLGTSKDYEIAPKELKSIRIPTLVLWTDKNPGTGPESGQRLAQLIPGAEFHCIMDAAHWPQWEKAEEHDSVVKEFLLGS